MEREESGPGGRGSEGWPGRASLPGDAGVETRKKREGSNPGGYEEEPSRTRAQHTRRPGGTSTLGESSSGRCIWDGVSTKNSDGETCREGRASCESLAGQGRTELGSRDLPEVLKEPPRLRG